MSQTRQRGSVYRVKGGFGIRWREDGRLRRHAPRPPFPTKTDAREWFLDNVLRQLNGGPPVSDRRMTFRAFAERYVRMHGASHEPVSTATLKYRVEHYAVPTFGDVPLAELERMTLAVAEWREGLPRQSAYGIVQAFRQVLNAAVAYELIRVNPAVKAGTNPQPRPKEIRPFTVEEVDRIAVELADDDSLGYGPPVVFAAETGLMPQEWIALERRDIRRDEGVVVVERSFSDGRVKGYGKTVARRRRVPLSARALDALKSHPARIDTRLLFPAPDGGYLDLPNWRSREWYPALEAAGLERRGPYALRHTFATWALAAGLGTFELARYMGTSLEMVERHYGHLAAGSEEHARGKLDAYHKRLADERERKAKEDHGEQGPS